MRVRLLRQHRSETGAAAVEGAIVIAAVLGPLLIGVLTFGQYFWDEQQVSLYPPRLDQSQIIGSCTSAQIVDRVTSTASEAIYAANTSTLNSLGIQSVSQLVQYLSVTVASAGTVGADVNVSVNIPSGGRLGGIVGRTPLLFDATQRLDNVSVSTNGSSCSTPPT